MNAYHPPSRFIRKETVAEEIARLQREIAERQCRLQFLVLGDPRKGVHLQAQEGAAATEPPDA